MKKVLDRKIKFIWDFRGDNSASLAKHFQKHLEEFVIIEELKYDLSGVMHITTNHSMVYLVVAEFEMEEIREILNPHRGEYYDGP
ncbi:hypothetical protein [Flagellimonas nanhaiensis]|uniref:DUF3303 domain-containing protein n=1 Tax=Flagellimonas nanhaiensis TaxID=2292706 RepID=A0A371JL31_9FLAO|nr:hypothetical protein [Allomuricauda nanhaiensis]RDY57639.1 hypothetical protein DX873_18130 [Allomuricauda nanhaiensis]